MPKSYEDLQKLSEYFFHYNFLIVYKYISSKYTFSYSYIIINPYRIHSEIYTMLLMKLMKLGHLTYRPNICFTSLNICIYINKKTQLEW